MAEPEKEKLSAAKSEGSEPMADASSSSVSRAGWLCLILTWLTYAGITALRKPLGIGKKSMSQELHIGRTELGFLDMSFLLPYAVVQVTIGPKADGVPVRLALFFVVLVSSLATVSFGMWNSVYPLAFLLFVSGSAQAFAWPACVKVVSGWFRGRSSSNVFGIFGTCTSVGGIGGTLIAVWLVARWSWRYAFLPQSLVMLAFSFIVLFFMPIASQETLPTPQGSDSKSESTGSVNTVTLLKIQSVAELSLANFLIKLVRYAFFMWLPLFLSEQLHYKDSEAGVMSTTFEIGGFVGTLFSGAIIDRLYGGKLLSSMTGLLLAGCLSIVAFIMTSKLGFFLNCTMLFFAGAANVATDPIISAMVPMSLAELEGTNIKAGLASVLNGFGSVGVILEGPLIGSVADHFGWSMCLYLLVALQVVALFLVRRSAAYQRTAALS